MKQFYASEEELEKDNAKLRNEIIKNQQNTTKSVSKKRRRVIIIISMIILLYIVFKLTIGSIHLNIGLIDFITPYTKGHIFEVKINDTRVGSRVVNSHTFPIIPTILYLDNHSSNYYYTNSDNYYNISKVDGKYILDIQSYACYYKSNNVETLCTLDELDNIDNNLYSKHKTNIKYPKMAIYDYKEDKNIYKGKFIKDITPYIKEDGTYSIKIMAEYPTVSSLIEVYIHMQKEKKEEIIMNKINIKINDKTYSATLENNNTVNELLELLPLNITMQELNDNEKYYYFDKNLNNNPTQVKEIKKGDIMLYGNNCLVIFYKDFTTHYSYTKIGHIDSPEDLEEVLGNGNVIVNFEKQ